MREDLNALDELEMDDLWEHVRTRTPRTDPDLASQRSTTSRWLAGVVAILVAGSAFVFLRSGFRDGSTTPATVPPVSPVASKPYADPGGWSVAVPIGWKVQTFDLPGTTNLPIVGAMFSNVSLPAPIGPPKSSAQAGEVGFPDDAVALVISSTVRNWGGEKVWEPPLSVGDMSLGSAVQNSSTLDGLTFAGPDGQWFIATLRSGPNASSADLGAVRTIVASLNFEPPRLASNAGGPLHDPPGINNGGEDLSGFRVNNAWSGQAGETWMTVYAGAPADTPGKGAVQVFVDGEPSGPPILAGEVGPLTIESADRTTLKLIADTGQTLIFNVASRTFP